jgi:hypothetical protein
VTLAFHSDALSAELIYQQDGWLLWFFRPKLNEYQFFTREDVGGDIDDHTLNNPGNIVRYFESRLKAAGYEGVTRRSTATDAAVVAIWDFTPQSR